MGLKLWFFKIGAMTARLPKSVGFFKQRERVHTRSFVLSFTRNQSKWRFRIKERLPGLINNSSLESQRLDNRLNVNRSSAGFIIMCAIKIKSIIDLSRQDFGLLNPILHLAEHGQLAYQVLFFVHRYQPGEQIIRVARG